MLFLNLGCGWKTSDRPGVVNIDWSITLRIRTNPIFRLFVPLLLKGERLEHFRGLSKNILVHNLAKGIPFPDGSADYAYHSHVLEHIDREIAALFIRETFRVLKKGGILRIVVPDMENNCRNYLADIDRCETGGPEVIAQHDATLEPILEQAVRREAGGTSRQGPIRRRIENLILGDARQRGETHQWMYDRFNLEHLLRSCGFTQIHRQKFNTSAIPDWSAYKLDQNEKGGEYKPGSLYMEAIKA